MIQGHCKIAQHFNTNSGAQASEDGSELAAQQSLQRYTVGLQQRGKGGGCFRGLEACNLVMATISILIHIIGHITKRHVAVSSSTLYL
jgi:hypothetical protein